MKERIQALDGLRFLAAIGVLWIHAWQNFDTPRYYVGKVDITNLLAIGGNGVDLFFVISGFCMYYFYARKPVYTKNDFYDFLKKRWFRLSPAFYTATLVYLIYFKVTGCLPFILTSLFYLNSILMPYSIGAHFWTLGVEFQFYLIMPFVLSYAKTIGFSKTMLSTFGGLFLLAIAAVILLKDNSDILTNQIVFRGIEFAWGIVVAELAIKQLFKLNHKYLWLLLSVLVTFAGRVLISKQALNLSAHYYNLFKLVGFTLMGLGFAFILHLTITSTGKLNAFLSNAVFRTLGRISYSFYLWHFLILSIVCKAMILLLPNQHGLLMAALAAVISTILLYLVAKFSYRILEKPYLSIGNLTTK